MAIELMATSPARSTEPIGHGPERAACVEDFTSR